MSQFDCGAVIQQTVCPWPVWLRWVALAAASLPCVAAATSMQVAPVRMVLSTVRPVASMTVGNGEDVEIAVQAEVFAWSQENGKDVYRATQDVLVNPSIFRLPADSRQIVRIGLRVAGDAKERSYRIFLQQLPRDQALQTDTSAGVRLQTLLRVGVPIFVAPVVAATQQVQWHLQTVEADAGPTKAPMQGKRQVLVFDNRGSEHFSSPMSSCAAKQVSRSHKSRCLITCWPDSPRCCRSTCHRWRLTRLCASKREATPPSRCRTPWSGCLVSKRRRADLAPLHPALNAHRLGGSRRPASIARCGSRTAFAFTIAVAVALVTGTVRRANAAEPGAPVAALAAVTPPTPLMPLTPVILDVRINGQPVEATRPLLRRGDRLWFEKTEIEAWQLLVPRSPAVTMNGTDYYDLLTVLGMKLRFNEATQTVNLEVPPEAFKDSVARAHTPSRPPASDSVFGAFLNYDVALQRDRSGMQASGYLDAAVSASWGLVATSALAGQSAFDGGRAVTRLDSYYRFDNPDTLTRLTVGDAIARSATWSTPFRFGGVQFGTQFGLQPGYISYPTPTLRGSSGLPSAVEVYVNDTLRYQGRADAGPFAVTNVPVLTGAGEMRFAVTDALGVQRTFTTPYYVSSSLLRAGLSDYSVEFGWNRLFYGERSFDYGRPFASGTWRKGLDDNATVEVHGETGAASQTGGAGITWVMASVGEFAVHAAASRSSDAGSGRLVRTSFSRSSDDWNFAASRQTASRDFTQVGWQDSSSHVRGQTQVFAGRSFGRYGSLGSSYTLLRYSTGDRIAVVSVNWSIAVAGGGSLSTYVARTRQQSVPAQPTLTSIGVTFTLPLGDRQTASMSVQRVDGRTTTTAAIDRAPPADIDGGYGYRVMAARGGDARSEASLDWVGRYGIATAEAASFMGDTALRVRASGAIGSAGGLLFAARQSDDAFALVTVPGAAGLDVYRENHRMGTTDSQGRAIVSGLRAYEPNHISIHNADLPIEALIGKDALEVVPRFKGVAAATFDITWHVVANVVVRLPDGQPLPPGIEVRAEARAQPLLTGYGGAVSIDAPRANERFEARWRTGRCTFSLSASPATAESQSAANYVCAPIEGAKP